MELGRARQELRGMNDNRYTRFLLAQDRHSLLYKQYKLLSTINMSCRTGPSGLWSGPMLLPEPPCCLA